MSMHLLLLYTAFIIIVVNGAEEIRRGESSGV